MNFLVVVAVLAIIMVVMAWYANSSKRNKIYCTFRRVNKTKINKFVKMSSRYVVFDGGKFDIIPSCITFMWWDKGLIHQLFPQWVATLDFTHENNYPLDPNTLKPAIISPEVRKLMNKEEWVKSYAKGFTPPTNKKQNMMTQYLPWIAIMLVVLVGFFLYTQLQGQSMDIANIQNSLNAITR